jgi:hypothetical protein
MAVGPLTPIQSLPLFHSYPRQIRPGDRGEPKRKSALRPGGQKGCFRSSHKWMIRLIEEFRFGVVTRVYLVDQCGCITIIRFLRSWLVLKTH